METDNFMDGKSKMNCMAKSAKRKQDTKKAYEIKEDKEDKCEQLWTNVKANKSKQNINKTY